MTILKRWNSLEPDYTIWRTQSWRKYVNGWRRHCNNHMKILIMNPQLAKSNTHKSSKYYVWYNNSITNKITSNWRSRIYDPEHSVGGQGASWAPEGSRIVNRINNEQHTLCIINIIDSADKLLCNMRINHINNNNDNKGGNLKLSSPSLFFEKGKDEV